LGTKDKDIRFARKTKMDWTQKQCSRQQQTYPQPPNQTVHAAVCGHKNDAAKVRKVQ
jgi:hypothetical protein